MFWNLISKIVKKAVVIFQASEVWTSNTGTGPLCVCYDFLQTEAIFIILYSCCCHEWSSAALLLSVVHSHFNSVCLAEIDVKVLHCAHALQPNHPLRSFDLFVAVFTDPAGL